VRLALYLLLRLALVGRLDFGEIWLSFAWSPPVRHARLATQRRRMAARLWPTKS